MAVVCHLGFVGRLLALFVTTTWWSPLLCKIWSKSMQEFRKYETFNNWGFRWISPLKWWAVSTKPPIGTQQIHDGGRPPLKKPVKSPYPCNRMTDFDEIWYSDAYWTRTADVGLPLKFRIFENPRWRRPRILKNHKNRDISATVSPIYTKFGKLMQNWSLNRSTVKKNRISQIQDGGHLPVWKP